MNIFVTSPCPIESAQSLCDKHMKMCLESAQMVCTVSWELGIPAPYKPAYGKHVCTRWAGRTRENFEWLCLHGLEIAAQYTLRYGKEHSSEDVLSWAYTNVLPNVPKGRLTPFAQAMATQYKHRCAITAYRTFYSSDKRYFARWKFTSPPSWWDDPQYYRRLV